MGRRVAVLVVGLVVLAGCSAFTPGGATASGTATGTVTALPVPGADETATPVPGPPGVDPNGSVSPAALFAAHRAAVANRSYTWRLTHQLTDLATGSVVDGYEKRLQVDPNGAYLLETNRGDRQNQTMFVDGTVGYSRIVINNRTSRRVLQQAIDHRHYVGTGRYLQLFLDADDADVAAVERGGQRYYRIHVRGAPAALDERHPQETVHNYTATAYVRPSGLVRALIVSYDYTLRHDRVGVSFRLDYLDVGSTTVTRPDWIAGVTPTGTAPIAPSATPTGAPTETATATATPPETASNPRTVPLDGAPRGAPA